MSENVTAPRAHYDIYSDNGVLLLRKDAIITDNIRQRLMKIFAKPKFSDETTYDKVNYTEASKMSFSDVYDLAITIINNLSKDSDLSRVKTMLKEYDDDTYKHSLNVATLAYAFGVKLGFNRSHMAMLVSGAMVHDIGKTRIDKSILTKKGRFNQEERAIIEKHPTYGRQILLKEFFNTPYPVVEIAHQHHENYNGAGYPNGLGGRKIYNLAMIVHICDVFDALTQKRCYKEQIPRDKVWQIMDEGAGVMFDPVLYSQFKETVPMYIQGENIKLSNHTYCTVVGYNSQQPDDPLIQIGANMTHLKTLYRNVEYVTQN